MLPPGWAVVDACAAACCAAATSDAAMVNTTPLAKRTRSVEPEVDNTDEIGLAVIGAVCSAFGTGVAEADVPVSPRPKSPTTIALAADSALRVAVTDRSSRSLFATNSVALDAKCVNGARLDPVREVLTDRIAGSPVPGASAGGACGSVPLEVRAGARRASRSRRSRWPALPPGPEAVHGRKRSVAWTAVCGVPELRTSTLDLYVDEEDDRMVPGAGRDGSGNSERHAGDGRPVVGEVVAVEVK